MCACCPPDGLFPRHLMLGLLTPQANAPPGSYRHQFLSSAAMGGCGAYTRELRQLFQRLVEMTATFSNTPPLAQSAAEQIRITPSKLGDVALSEKAIPYYYLPDGTPPLNSIWDPEKTRGNRANLNLGYHCDQYAPPAPAFVTNALQYDIEPYNFLRVEGHLGKNYQSVLGTLLLLKSRYRLPIEIVALRTGAFDENMPVDLSKESCRFQDLETLYDTLKGEMSCFLCKEVRYFYALPNEGGSAVTVPAAPKLPMLVRCAPGFTVQPNTLGRLFEDWFSNLPGRNIADIDLNINLRFASRFNVLLFLIAYIARLYDQLADDLGQVNFAQLEKSYQDLAGMTEAIESQREQATGNIGGNAELLKWEELDDRLEAIIYNCRLEAFNALQAEYERRIKEVKQKQFLSFFLQSHPGVQHKAGVPLGGTFVVVYHETPAPVRPPVRPPIAGGNLSDVISAPSTLTASKALSGALGRLTGKAALLADPDIRIILGELTGQIPRPPIFPGAGGPDDETGAIYSKTVAGLEDGTVIADFFLPYLCCSDCAPIQYVLPVPPLGLAVQLGCTDPESSSAEATLTPQGGTAPFSYQLDAQPFAELGANLVLPAGPHTLQIRDSAGAQSKAQSFTVPGALAAGEARFIDDASANRYQVTFTISGGVPPYQAQSGTVAGNVFTSEPAPSGERIAVAIADRAGCKVSAEFQHTVCQLPCGGQSRRCAYRLWVQPPSEGAFYKSYQQAEIRFRFNGESFGLPGDLLQLDAGQLNTDFENAVGTAVKRLNAAINTVLTEKFGDLGRDRLDVFYDPAATDPFRTLRIEHYVCETFAIEFDYSYAQPNPAFSLTMRYGNEPDANGVAFDGAVLLNRRLNKETRVPAFDCSERNQCEGSDYRNLCEGFNPQPFISIGALPTNSGFLFTGGVVDTSQKIIAWVWDLLNAQTAEPFYEGEKVEAQVHPPSGEVRLSVITEKGCFSAVTQRIES